MPDVLKIGLYDDVTPESAKEIAMALLANPDADIELHINSPGGDVFEARAMVAAVRAHGAPVTTYIDGLAASAATYLALAGDIAGAIRVSRGAASLITITRGIRSARYSASSRRRLASACANSSRATPVHLSALAVSST